MQAVIQFLIAHQVALAGIGMTLLQEFISKAKFISGNTLGEAIYNYTFSFLNKIRGADAGK